MFITESLNFLLQMVSFKFRALKLLGLMELKAVKLLWDGMSLTRVLFFLEFTEFDGLHTELVFWCGKFQGWD
jgi:hypothetical protein